MDPPEIFLNPAPWDRTARRATPAGTALVRSMNEELNLDVCVVVVLAKLRKSRKQCDLYPYILIYSPIFRIWNDNIYCKEHIYFLKF